MSGRKSRSDSQRRFTVCQRVGIKTCSQSQTPWANQQSLLQQGLWLLTRVRFLGGRDGRSSICTALARKARRTRWPSRDRHRSLQRSLTMWLVSLQGGQERKQSQSHKVTQKDAGQVKYCRGRTGKVAMQKASLVTEGGSGHVLGRRVKCGRSPSVFHKGKSRGLQKEQGPLRRAARPGRYSLCEPVSVCLSLFTFQFQVVVAAVVVKSFQPKHPGKSRDPAAAKVVVAPSLIKKTYTKPQPESGFHTGPTAATTHSPCPTFVQRRKDCHLRKRRVPSHMLQ